MASCNTLKKSHLKSELYKIVQSRYEDVCYINYYNVLDKMPSIGQDTLIMARCLIDLPCSSGSFFLSQHCKALWSLTLRTWMFVQSLSGQTNKIYVVRRGLDDGSSINGLMLGWKPTSGSLYFANISKVVCTFPWSVVAERSSLPDSSSGVSSRMWVRIPAVTLVSLSKTLNHNCFSPPRG